MKQLSSVYSTISLIVVNLIPLYGVIFHGWNINSLMILYWLENVIIGFFTVLKMFKAEGMVDPMKYKKVTLNGKPMSAFAMATGVIKRSFFIPFFAMHFGMFTLVHGIFTLIIFYSSDINWFGVFISFLSLFVSHGVSYVGNFLHNEEYKKVSVEYLFISPYPRIIVMHLTVILGAMFVFNNHSMYALILLIVLKTCADLGSHVFEHRNKDKPLEMSFS